MNPETEEILKNIARIICGHEKFTSVFLYKEMMKNLEKFLLNLENYKNDKLL